MFNTQFTTKKVNLNLDLRQYAFLNNNFLNFEKTQFLTRNGVKQSFQQQRCLAGKKKQNKTSAYNKKLLKRGKRQFLIQNGVKQILLQQRCFPEKTMQNTRLCLW